MPSSLFIERLRRVSYTKHFVISIMETHIERLRRVSYTKRFVMSIMETQKGRKGTQPIVFGTPLACLWIVTGAWLICESRSSDEWLRRSVGFSERAAANGPARSNAREPTFWQVLVFQCAVPVLPETPSPTCTGRSFQTSALSEHARCKSESAGTR